MSGVITIQSGGVFSVGSPLVVGPNTSTPEQSYTGYATSGNTRNLIKWPGTAIDKTTKTWEITSWTSEDADFDSGHLWVIDKNTVVAGNAGRLVKIDQATGQELADTIAHLTASPQSMSTGRIAVDDSGNVYWGTYTNATSFQKFDTSGVQQWATVTIGKTKQVLYRDGAVYVASDDNNYQITKFDAATGAKIWDTNTLGSFGGWTQVWDMNFIPNGNLAVAVNDRVDEVSPTSGSVITSTQLASSWTNTRIAANSTHIYVSTSNGTHAIEVGNSGIVASTTNYDGYKGKAMAYRTSNDTVYMGEAGFMWVTDLSVSGSTLNLGSLTGGLGTGIGGWNSSGYGNQLVMFD